MNFVILDAANIRLKHAIVYGIKGFEPLHKTLNDVWMPDIKRNQLPTVLAGLAPVRSLVNIGTGMRDVVAIPIREYQKDGRIVRSIQKGAFHFGKTTTSELARLGAKVALGTQTLLSGAEGFLTPSSSSPSGRPSVGRRRSSEQGWQDVDSEDEERETRALSAYANQPLGVFAGLRSARAHLEHDLLTARDALIAVQGEILESSSAGGAAAAVVKHAPTVILRPIIGTSRAVGTALLGVGNQIDQGHLRKVEDVSCFDFEHLRWKPC
jgi:autophagy-related protein 2